MTSSTRGSATAWDAAAVLVGRRTLLKYALVAAGGALVSACGGSPKKTTPAAPITEGVIAQVLLGTWRVLPWEGPEGPPVEEAAQFGLTSVFDIPRVFPPDPPADAEEARPWPLVAEITESGFSVTPNGELGMGWSTDQASGTWAWQDGGLSVNLDDDTFSAVGGDPEYFNQAVATRGVPETVGPEASGRFEWGYDKGDPDFVSYSVARGMIHLFLPKNAEGVNYLAQRA